MSPEPSVNLLDEPWIRVLTDDGRPDEVSLLDLFRRADGMRQLSGDIGTQAFATMRLALAVLHRALDATTPRGADAVPAVVERLRTRWDDVVLPAVTGYLARHRERFWLFHPTAPFFQVAGMGTADGKVSDLAKLVVDVPNGHPYLTMRSARGLRRITAAEAARWLVHVHAFDPSGIKTGVVGHPRAKNGKVYPEGAAWAGHLGGLHLIGATLRDTLLLNLWAAIPDDEARAMDLPPWEREPDPVGEGRGAVSRPYGPVGLYTWQARRVRLVGDAGGVTGVVLTYGDRLIVQERQDLRTIEPMTAWRYSKPQTAKYGRDVLMPRGHLQGAQLWTGLATLIRPRQQRSKEDGLPARVIEHAAGYRGSPLLPFGLVRLHAIGVAYGSQSSVVDDILDDGLDLPAALLDPAERELRSVAIAAVDAARAGADAVRNLAGNLARASGASGDSLEGPRARAREQAYATLDPLYRQWLRDVLRRHPDDLEVAEREWHTVASRALRALGEDLVAHVPATAWRGFDANGPRADVGRVYVWFTRALSTAFPKADRPPRSPVETAADGEATTLEEVS